MTYTYPNSIQEAAKILDRARPDWATVLSKKEIDMTESNACVLGHLYGSYFRGIDVLFGSYYGTWNVDSIFGTTASTSTWREEINRRLKPVENTSKLSNLEAFQALLDGKKLKAAITDYFYLKDGRIFSDKGTKYSFSLFDDTSVAWSIYEEPQEVKWEDIPYGRRFILSANPTHIYKKMSINVDNECRWAYDEKKKQLYNANHFSAGTKFYLVEG